MGNASQIPAAVLAIETLGGRVVFDFENGFDGANPPENAPQRSTLERLFSSPSSQARPRAIFVRMGGEGISNDSLALLRDFPDLEGISITNSIIDDDGLRHLSGLQRLKRLRIIRSRIRGPGLESIAALPELSLLNLGTSPVEDTGIAVLRQAPELKNLILRSPNVTDLGAAHLAEIPKLEQLSIDGTAISGGALRHFRCSNHLKGLSLGALQLTAGDIEQLTQLKLLWLDPNDLDPVLEDQLRAARPRLLINGVTVDL